MQRRTATATTPGDATGRVGRLVRRAAAVLAAGLAAWAAPTAGPGPGMAAAQDYPTRALRIVVPFSAGTGGDIVTRTVATQLEARLGQTVSVVNQAGAGGALGIAAVMNAPADGYSLVFGPQSTITLNPLVVKDTPFGPFDLVPVSILTTDTIVMLSAPQGRLRDIDDLRRHVRGGGSVRFGTVGAGTSGHVMGEALGRALGGSFVHVPYREFANGLRDVASGDIEVFFTGVGSVYRQIGAGAFRAMAISDSRRRDCLPGVGTFLEQGVDLDISQWFGLFVAPATPPAIVARLNREINAALATDETRRVYASMCLSPGSVTPEEFKDRVKADHERWKALLAGVKLDSER